MAHIEKFFIGGTLRVLSRTFSVWVCDHISDYPTKCIVHQYAYLDHSLGNITM